MLLVITFLFSFSDGASTIEASEDYENIVVHNSGQMLISDQCYTLGGVGMFIRTIGNFSWDRPFTASVWRIDTGAWSQGRIVEVPGTRETRNDTTTLTGGWTSNTASIRQGSMVPR